MFPLSLSDRIMSNLWSRHSLLSGWIERTVAASALDQKAGSQWHSDQKCSTWQMTDMCDGRVPLGIGLMASGRYFIIAPAYWRKRF